MNNEEAIKIVANWLKDYNNYVVVKVMGKYEQIINDKTTYTMLSKLYEEENKEHETFVQDIKDMIEFGINDDTKDMLRLGDYSRIYRDVLYDLYIR